MKLQTPNLAAGQGSKKGFTMIELLIVIVIGGVLVGIAIFTYLSQIPMVRLRGDTWELYQYLEMTKMRAMSTSHPHGVVFIRGGQNEPDRYYMFTDCNDNRYYDDDAADNPFDNHPLATWENCISPTFVKTYDPMVQGEKVKALSPDNRWDEITGSTTKSGITGSPREFVIFTPLGQVEQGPSNYVNENNPIWIKWTDPNSGNQRRKGVTIMGTSGMIEILETQE